MPSPVVLHLYDLSGGLARQMSPMLLGKTIDGIWHTGVAVYGQEYFFGGGIQAMRHEAVIAQFGLHPVQKLEMGSTDVSQADFMEFLRSIRHRFTAATYDLFRHNCNNFSDEVCMFLLGRPIPSYITGLPAEVLATPMGAMIGQMMTGMQQNMGAHMHDPFTARASAPLPPPVAAPAPAPAVVLAPRDLTKPLLSSASDALPAVAARLIKLGSAIETTPALLTPEDEAILIAGGDALKSAGGNDAPGYDFTPACDVVKRVLETWTPQALAQAYFPSLCILRVLVLQEPAAVYWTTTGATVFDSLFTTALVTMPVTARVMLFAATSNLFKHEVGITFLTSPSRLSIVLDAILAEMVCEKTEGRQMATACLLNYAPHLGLTDPTGSVSDVAVQVLNAVFEGLAAESDAECVRRRLLTGERLLTRGGAELISLATVLEYPSAVTAVTTRPGLDPTIVALASEVNKLF